MALNLFWIFFKVGFFCFGGGNAMIGVFERMLVWDYGYLTSRQFADIIAISQITPGPVAVNLATYVGAVLGNSAAQSIFYSFVATLGVSLPAFIFILIIARFFEHYGNASAVKWVMGGIKPGVIGLIVASVLLMCRLSLYDGQAAEELGVIKALNYGAIFLACVAFAINLKTKINPVVILIASGIAGIIFF